MKKLLRFKDGNIAVAENIGVRINSESAVEEIDISKKSEKEIEAIKKQLTKSFKDSKLKKADDVAADSEKKTLK